MDDDLEKRISRLEAQNRKLWFALTGSLIALAVVAYRTFADELVLRELGRSILP